MDWGYVGKLALEHGVPVVLTATVTGAGMAWRNRVKNRRVQEDRNKAADSVPALSVKIDSLDKQTTVQRQEQRDGFSALQSSVKDLSFSMQSGMVEMKAGLSVVTAGQLALDTRVNAMDTRLERVERNGQEATNRTTAILGQMQLDHGRHGERLAGLEAAQKVRSNVRGDCAPKVNEAG